MDPLIGTLILFAGNFAPRGWALCDGQLLPISSHSALFSILGTQFGGDGRTTFALPDLRGRVPMHPGNGPGLSPRRIGDKLGEETVTLTTNQIPRHSHGLMASNAVSDTNRPADKMMGRAEMYTADKTNLTELDAASGGYTGGGMAHDNIQPSLCINYIIALEGIFPSRS